MLARAIAPRLESRIGRHVTVENKPSPNGTTAGEALVKGTRDGSTVALIGSETLAGRLSVRDYPFEPMTDITPVTIAGASQTAIAVARNVGVGTFVELLEWLKAGGPEPGASATPSVPPSRTSSQAPRRASGRQTRDRALSRHRADAHRHGKRPHSRRPRRRYIVARISSRAAAEDGDVVGEGTFALAPNVPTATEVGFPALQVTEWFGFFLSSAVPAAVAADWNSHLAAVSQTAR